MFCAHDHQSDSLPMSAHCHSTPEAFTTHMVRSKVALAARWEQPPQPSDSDRLLHSSLLQLCAPTPQKCILITPRWCSKACPQRAHFASSPSQLSSKACSASAPHANTDQFARTMLTVQLERVTSEWSSHQLLAIPYQVECAIDSTSTQASTALSVQACSLTGNCTTPT